MSIVCTHCHKPVKGYNPNASQSSHAYAAPWHSECTIEARRRDATALMQRLAAEQKAQKIIVGTMRKDC